MILRSFIAIEVPHFIQQAIYRLTIRLRQEYPTPGIRWVPINNIHLTLKFLGEVPSQNLDILAHSLDFEINQLEPFSIPFSETGVFPNIKKPRIICIGLDYLPGLVNLFSIIESTSSKLGYPREDRPFSPHITIGRVGESFPPALHQKLLTDLSVVDITSIDPVLINSIKVFKSDLKPKGPEYTVIRSIPFKDS
jgi:2'-5' RNA ligase